MAKRSTEGFQTPRGPAGPEVRRYVIVSALLVLGTFAAYSRVLSHEFIYLDDRAYVTENPVVLQGLTGKGLTWAFTTIHASNWHPLTWLSHMLDCELFGVDARGHHFTSLLLHCANVWLLFTLLTMMTSSLWCSAFVAALFGIHPLHVESVAWVAERKDVLSTFFGFLTLLAYVRYARRPAPARYALVVLLLVLGLLAKPMLVTWPCVMLLLDYWPLGRVDSVPPLSRGLQPAGIYPGFTIPKLILEKLPLFALVLLSGAATVHAQRRGGAVAGSTLIPFDARVTNALLSYVGYVKATLWPAGLAVYYPHSYKAAPLWQVGSAVLLLGTITIPAVWAWRRRPYFIVGWLWYLGTLVPVIGLMQVGSQAMADRYTYIPLTGIFIMIVWSVRDVARRLHSHGVLPGLVGVVCLVLLTVATRRQVGYWRDSVTLFTHALKVTRDNAPVHVFLAQTLHTLGRSEESIYHYTQAARLHPNDMDTAYNLGLALYMEGRIEPAIARFYEVVRRRPDFAAAHFHLGSALARKGRFVEAASHSATALRLNPALLRAQFDLGVALAGQGRHEEAVAHFEQWLRAAPDSAEGHLKLGDVYLSLNRFAKAAEHYAAALRIRPDDAEAQAKLAEVRARQEAAE